jgi:hypothetical protein
VSTWDVGQTWERGDSRRVIDEVTAPLHAKGGRALVMYALYRRRPVWRKPDEWCYLRRGYALDETISRWVRGATLVATPAPQPVIPAEGTT